MKKAQGELNSPSFKQNAGDFLKAGCAKEKALGALNGAGPCLGHLGLLAGFYPEEKQTYVYDRKQCCKLKQSAQSWTLSLPQEREQG